MTITIEVRPEIEHRWREIAEREGRALEEVAAQAAEKGTDLTANQVCENPPRRELKARGKFAHINVSSEDLLRSRREEVELEEEKFQRHFGGAS